MEAIFLPIKPVYASRIISGEKIYEFRKTMPARRVSHIVIYASSPQQAIVGIAQVDKVLSAPVEKLWEQTSKSAGIDKISYLKYFCGKEIAYAYQLKKIRKLSQNISPHDLWENFTIPQSFRYLPRILFEQVNSLDTENEAD
ncbi:ASCH domain-containing protein [Maridesulfovibrio sp.]|uniref:ASCH domain-containing protein n=1 Tax=Maridesulfovibrio sp. TaxID=2795000 RepID=UPI0039EEC7EC